MSMNRERPYANFHDREARLFHMEEAPPPGAAILIVSADERGRAEMKKLLVREGYSVYVASRLRYARELMGHTPFAVVLAESALADCCWKDVWRGLEHGGARPRARLIVMAAGDDAALWQEADDFGAREVIAKPFSDADLLAAVADAAADWRRERAVKVEPARTRPAAVRTAAG